MNIHGMRNTLSGKCAAAFLALLFLAYPTLCDDTPKAAAKAPNKAPAKSSAPAAKPASGGASSSHNSGPTTVSHGPTTSSHSPTTTSTTQPTTTTAHPAATEKKGGTSATEKRAGIGATEKKGGTATDRNGIPAANGHITTPTKNGSVTKRPGGQVATIPDTKRGMEVHHTLSGSRRVVVERPDHSRIVAERGGRGYVQGPYRFHDHEYARRSYYYRGRYYNNYYGRYYYRGVYVNPYYPTYYYGPAYYGWVSYPWGAPAPYAWGWNVNPWYGYYGAFFTPYAVYSSASFWLTDYIIANSLAAAYQAQAVTLSDPAPLTLDVKQLIADEVKQQVLLEYNEAQAAGKNPEPDAASSSIQRALTDGNPHVFVAGHDLDVVDAEGRECALSEGDALQLPARTAADAKTATLAVLASKGGKECPKGDTVSVAFEDLQEMQNHMRETIDQGLQELQKKQGQGGLPAAPVAAKAAPVESPMAALAPPPPPESEVAAQIKEQSQEADKAETEAGTDTASGPKAVAPTFRNGQR